MGNRSSAVKLVRNLVAHGDAREGKWRGNWRMEWVASTLTPPPNLVYPALLKLMRTPRLPAVDWTDDPHRFKWTRPFRGKTKSGFWACAITFRTRYTTQTEKRTNQVWNCQSQWGLERYKTTRVTDWALNVISRRLGVWSILTSERNVKTESDKPQT